MKDLVTAIHEFIEVHSQDSTHFGWTNAADQILASIAHYAQRTITAHHTRPIARTTGAGD